MINQHGFIQHRCNICDTFLSTKFNLQRHKAMHQPNVERLKCDKCGITCANEYNYQKHCMRRHQRKSRRTPKTVLEPSKCMFCGEFLPIPFCLINLSSHICIFVPFFLVPYRINATISKKQMGTLRIAAKKFEIKKINQKFQ